MAIHYNNNGTGRDSYIYTNNGGFTIHHSGSAMSNCGSMLTSKRPIPAMKFSPHNGHAIGYNNDGSGRDGYIFHNNGGFNSPTFKNFGKNSFYN